MDEVVFEYQLTYDECRRILLGASPKANRAVIIILLGIAVIGAGGAIASHEWIGALATVTFISFCLTMRIWHMPRRIWKYGLGIQEPRKVTFNRDGIVSKSESVELKFPWSRFSSTRETKEFFVLLTSRNAPEIVVPNRGLRTAEDEKRLRSILEAHAPVTYGDRVIRRGLAMKLLLLSVSVIVIVFIYVEFQIR